jgi:mRNA interferase MazF
MSRGDIWAVEFPIPAGSSGHEQIGTRPAVVVQTDLDDARLPTTIVVPMTSKPGANRFPYAIEITASDQNGISRASVLLVFQLRAIDKRRLGKKLGNLEPHYIHRMEDGIRTILGL